MTREHKDLQREDVTCIVDTREQAPLDLLLPSEPGTLACGDYSIKGLENYVAIERKSLPDLLMCCGRERERFEACVQRMKGYEVRVLVIEATWTEIYAGMWRSQLKPAHVKGALMSWMRHMSVILAGDRQTAAAIVSGILFSAARDRWRTLQAFQSNLRLAGSDQ